MTWRNKSSIVETFHNNNWCIMNKIINSKQNTWNCISKTIERCDVQILYQLFSSWSMKNERYENNDVHSKNMICIFLFRLCRIAFPSKFFSSNKFLIGRIYMHSLTFNYMNLEGFEKFLRYNQMLLYRISFLNSNENSLHYG